MSPREDDGAAPVVPDHPGRMPIPPFIAAVLDELEAPLD